MECPRIGAETHQSCRLAPDWKAYRPLPTGTGTIPAKRCQKLGRNRSDLPYTARYWEAKMEIPDKLITGWIGIGMRASRVTGR